MNRTNPEPNEVIILKYCNYCHRMIKPEKKVNYFILLLLTFFTGGSWLLFYAIYYFFFKTPVCPICGGDSFLDFDPHGR